MSFRSSLVRRRGMLVVCGAVARVIASPCVVCAIDGTWTMNSNGNWNVATNWSTNPSVPNGVGDTARFLSAINAARTISQNVVGLTLGQIEFNDDNSYLISGNAITLDATANSASVTVNTSNGSAAHAISSDMVLADAVVATTNASSALPLTFGGAISGSGGLVKSGAGHLLFTGGFANTYTGDTIVNEGTLELFKSVSGSAATSGNLIIGDGVGGANADVAIAKNGGVPNGATVTVNSSGKFEVASAENVTNLSFAGGNATIAGGSVDLVVLGQLSSTAHANQATISGPGPINLALGVTVNVADGAAANDLLISTQVQGIQVTKQGAGTLVLSASNVYGATTISAGTLQIGNGALTGTLGQGNVVNNATLNFKRTGSLTVGNTISGSGNIELSAAGAVAFTATNTYMGTTTVSGTTATIQVGNFGTTGMIGPGDVILTGAGSALTIARTDSITVPNNISGIGGVVNGSVGTTSLTGVVTATGAMVANNGRLILNQTMPNTASVFCSGNGVVELASNGSAARVMKAGHVNFSGSGKLDLRDNKLILTNLPLGTWNGSAYTQTTGWIRSGRGDGSWNGSTGIITSMTDATTSVLTTLAVSTGAAVRGLGPTDTDTWAGQTINGNSVLVMYTWGGDADLNGELNGDDYFYIDSNVINSGSVFGYHNGDFDYNGVIDGDDYFILDSNITFAQNSAPFPTGSASSPLAGAGGMATVPEPAGILMLIGALLPRVCRRR